MQSSGTDGVGKSWDNVATQVYLELIQVNIEITQVLWRMTIKLASH